LLPAKVGDETISIGSYPRAVDDEMVRSQAALKELNCSYSGAERLHVWRAIRAELEDAEKVGKGAKRFQLIYLCSHEGQLSRAAALIPKEERPASPDASL
jgi:hypothetical protein